MIAFKIKGQDFFHSTEKFYLDIFAHNNGGIHVRNAKTV